VRTCHVVVGITLLGMAIAAPASGVQRKTAPVAAAPAAGLDPVKAQPAATPAARSEPLARQHGAASFYSDRFGGRKTATGETFSQNKLTAASRDLPLGARVTVTNRQNGKSVDVKVNDRGPYVRGRVIDLSKSAARKIGLGAKGLAPVTVEARPSHQETAELKEAVRKTAVAQSERRSGETTVALAGDSHRYDFRE
jgi:rare lipoprotein A